MKDAAKLTLQVFDDKKKTWTAYAQKLCTALLECVMSYLMTEKKANAKHSKNLVLELYKK